MHEEEFIKAHATLLQEKADWQRECLELREEKENLINEKKRLEEKIKIMNSNDVKRLLDLLCLKSNTDNIAMYTELSRKFYSDFEDWKYFEEEEWIRANDSEKKFWENESNKREKRATTWMVSFWVLFGSWIVLLIKLFI